MTDSDEDRCYRSNSSIVYPVYRVFQFVQIRDREISFFKLPGIRVDSRSTKEEYQEGTQKESFRWDDPRSGLPILLPENPFTDLNTRDLSFLMHPTLKKRVFSGLLFTLFRRCLDRDQEPSEVFFT